MLELRLALADAPAKRQRQALQGRYSRANKSSSPALAHESHIIYKSLNSITGSFPSGDIFAGRRGAANACGGPGERFTE
jgi:hypothetical protein